MCSVKSDSEILQTVARQPPLSMGFSRQEHRSGLLFPSSGDLPNPGIKPMSLEPVALSGRFFITEPAGKPQVNYVTLQIKYRYNSEKRILNRNV